MVCMRNRQYESGQTVKAAEGHHDMEQLMAIVRIINTAYCYTAQ